MLCVGLSCDRHNNVSKHWFEQLPSQKYRIEKYSKVIPQTINEQNNLLRNIHQLYFEVDDEYNKFEENYAKSMMVKIRNNNVL